MTLHRSLLVLALLAAVASPARAAPACADAETMIDTRDDIAVKSPDVQADARAGIVREAFGDAKVDVVISAAVAGAFTAPGARETAHLVQRVDPTASPVAPIDAVLVVLAEGKPMRRIGTALGQRVDGVLRGIGKAGTDALLLRAEAYNMGQSSARLVLVEVVGDTLVERATFDEARTDACDDARFGGFVEAIRVYRCGVTQAPQAWTIERLRAACVDGKAPPANAFKALVQGKP
jgi:hypothetical protein